MTPKTLLLYALTVPVFFAVDMVWLGTMTSRFYRPRLGELLAPQVNWAAGLLFYFLYIAAILALAVLPALEHGSAGRAVRLGAVLGFAAYATYDLTNLATLRGWPLSVTLVDMAWGTVLTGTVAGLSFLIGRAIGR